MLRLLVFFAIAAACACNQQPPSAAPQPEKPESNAVVFQFSTARMIQELYDDDNWCRPNLFAEAVLVNADQANISRRFFLLGDGVYQVAPQVSGMTAAFMLRKKGANKIEVFTAQNFPHCLFNPVYCTLTDGGQALVYDYNGQVKYTVTTQLSSEGTFVIIHFRPEDEYRLSVNKCKSCR